MTINGEVIETTKEHPFWIEGQGWTAAELLKAGDVVRLESGENDLIDSVEVLELDGYIRVYNFEVEDFHTYYVSDDDVLVHNACKATDLSTIKQGTKDWDNAVKSIKSGGNTSFRVETSTDAKALLKQARGSMDRFKPYKAPSSASKFFEFHPSEALTRNAPHNNLPHIKWNDWISGATSGKGHIFFNLHK